MYNSSVFGAFDSLIFHWDRWVAAERSEWGIFPSLVQNHTWYPGSIRTWQRLVKFAFFSYKNHFRRKLECDNGMMTEMPLLSEMVTILKWKSRFFILSLTMCSCYPFFFLWMTSVPFSMFVCLLVCIGVLDLKVSNYVVWLGCWFISILCEWEKKWPLNKFKTKKDNSKVSNSSSNDKESIAGFFDTCVCIIVFRIWYVIIIIPLVCHSSIDFGRIKCNKWGQYFSLNWYMCHR